MQAEVPQPISAVPVRWGGFTGRQIAWLISGLALPYLLLRAGSALPLALGLPTPWMAAALLLAFGRREGRQLDAWVGDLLLFAIQPHRLRHPDSALAAEAEEAFFSVDRAPEPDHRAAAALPWVEP